MLQRKRRIPKAFFEKIAQTRGTFLVSEYFSIKIVPVSPSEETRFAGIVSKKVSPLSVRRNAIRRLLYRILMTLYPNIQPGFLVLFSFKPKVNIVEHGILKREIESLLKRGGVLKK
jgi:ribonuclease P protein component